MRSPIVPALVLALAPGLLAACRSAQTSVVGPTTDSKCQINAAPSPSAFTATGGNGTLSITTSRDCTWTIATSTSWVSLSGDRSGQGEAAVTFTVAANPAAAARSGTIAVGSQTVEVSQAAAPCRYTLSRARDGIGPGGGALSVDVTTLSGCNWTATSRAAWITVTSARSGTASGTIALSIAANSGDPRVGEVDVNGQIYTVVQEAVPPPPAPPTVTPAPAPPPAPAPAPPSPSPSPAPGPAPAPAPAPKPTPPPTPTPVPDVGERVEVDGSVKNLSGKCPSLSFTVDGESIVTNASTDFKKGNCGHVESSRKVDVKGTRLPNGSVLASEVEISRGNND